MTKAPENTPSEISDDKLDDISGGPHIIISDVGPSHQRGGRSKGSVDRTIRKWDMSTSE